MNSQLKQLLQRIPQEAIEAVIRHYLHSNDAFYVKAMHPIGLLLRDAEKLYVEVQRGGIRISSFEAQELDRLEASFAMWNRIKERLDAEERNSQHDA